MSDQRPDDRPDDEAPFVPDGAGAEAWRSYVDRVRERRFRALLAAIDAAVMEGNTTAARAALAEAQELEPDASELAERADRVAAIELVTPAEVDAVHRRSFGAAAAVVAAAIAMLAILTAMLWLWRPEPASIIVIAPPPADVPVGTTARLDPPPAAAASPDNAGAPPDAVAPPAAAAAPAPAAPAAPARADRIAAPSSNASVADRLAIRRAVDRYAASYSRLDADAVVAISSGAEPAQFAREFARRERQDLHFRRCLIEVHARRATARCVGELRYTPGVGVPASRPVRWDFTMVEQSGEWGIEDVMRR